MDSNYPKELGFCKNCNTPSQPHSKFCNRCGAALQLPEILEPLTEYRKSCAYCAETIKEEAIKCKFCGSDLIKPIVAEARYIPHSAVTPTTKLGCFPIGCLSIVGLFFLAMFIGSGSSHKQNESISTKSKSTVTYSAKPTADSIRTDKLGESLLGKSAYVTSGKNDVTWVSDSLETYSDFLITALVANDEQGCKSLVAQGKLVVLEPHTLVEVIDEAGDKSQAFFYYKIHVQQGTYIGMDFWAPSLSVHKL